MDFFIISAPLYFYSLCLLSILSISTSLPSLVFTAILYSTERSTFKRSQIVGSEERRKRKRESNKRFLHCTPLTEAHKMAAVGASVAYKIYTV